MLYSKLGVSKYCTDLKIKKCYETFVEKLHPVLDAEELQIINRTYSILSDPIQKQIYDSPFWLVKEYKYESKNDITDFKNLIAEFHHFSQKFQTFFIFATSCFRSIIEMQNIRHKKEIEGQKQESIKRKGQQQNITIQSCFLKVYLSDIYNCKKQQFDLIRKDIHGNNCLETISIPLSNFTSKHVFDNIGDEYYIDINKPHLGVMRNNIEVMLGIDNDSKFELFDVFNSYDLSYTYKISLFEYCFGCSIELDIFGKTVAVNYPGGSPKSVLLHNMGLPYTNDRNELSRGILYVFFELDLPQCVSFLQKKDKDDEKTKKEKELMFHLIEKYFKSTRTES